MRLFIPVLAVLALACASAAGGQPAPLDNTTAFEKSYATSYFALDACGDTEHGRIFRQVLVDRFRQCPFTPAARDAFKIRAAILREKSTNRISALIEANGGLLTKVEGMTMTCREQQHLPEYIDLAAKLDKYAAGQLAAVDVAPAPCDAQTITP